MAARKKTRKRKSIRNEPALHPAVLNSWLWRHGQLLRACYCEEVRLFYYSRRGVDRRNLSSQTMPWDPDLNASPPKMGFWIPLLYFAYHHHTDPCQLIRATCRGWTGLYPPTPPQIASHKGLELVRAQREQLRVTLVDLLRAAVQRLTVACWSRMEARRSVLIEERQQACLTGQPIPPWPEETDLFGLCARETLLSSSSDSPLARVLFAYQSGLPDLAKADLHEAAIEFLVFPEAYQAALDSLLPVDLVRYAQERLMPALDHLRHEAEALFGLTNDQSLP